MTKIVFFFTRIAFRIYGCLDERRPRWQSRALDESLPSTEAGCRHGAYTHSRALPGQGVSDSDRWAHRASQVSASARLCILNVLS